MLARGTAVRAQEKGTISATAKTGEKINGKDRTFLLSQG